MKNKLIILGAIILILIVIIVLVITNSNDSDNPEKTEEEHQFEGTCNQVSFPENCSKIEELDWKETCERCEEAGLKIIGTGN